MKVPIGGFATHTRGILHNVIPVDWCTYVSGLPITVPELYFNCNPKKDNGGEEITILLFQFKQFGHNFVLFVVMK